MRRTVPTIALIPALCVLAVGCTPAGTDERGAADDISGELRAGETSTPPGSPAPTGGTAQATREVVAASDAFLDGLTAEQRRRATFDVDDPAVRDWFYFPSTDDRNGVALGDLSSAQRTAALRVAESVLSESGYRQMRDILTAEDRLGERNDEPEVTSGRYFLAFFGEPDDTEQFTIQINGHHLAINHTYENGRISPTPSFTGTDPVDFTVRGQRVRPMLTKTRAVSGLLDGMTADQLDRARIDPIDDVRVGTGETTTFPESEGVAVSELPPRQREQVTAVVRAWAGDTDERLVDDLVQRYESAFDRTRIAWAGSRDPNEPGTYLRLDGPQLWIEFSNVGRFGNGDDHYHSVHRDKRDDYLGSATP